MQINIHHHHHDEGVNKKLKKILKRLKQIEMNQAEMAAELTAMKDQNEKSHAEIVAKFAELETAVANAGNSTPEVDAAMAALKTSIQADDDLIADAPPAGGGE